MRVKVGSELARRAQEFLSDPGIDVVCEVGGRIRLAGRPVGSKNRAALRRGLLRADLGSTIESRDDIDYGGGRVNRSRPIHFPGEATMIDGTARRRNPREFFGLERLL